MRHPLVSVLLGGAVLLGALSACNRGDDPAIDASGTSTSTTTTAAPVTDTSAPPVPGGTAVPVSTPAVKERAYLTAVRVDTKADGSSRVVFEFDPVVPGHKVDFVKRPVTMDGSGDEVPVGGESVVEVTMVNAAQARFEGEKVIPTYTGPRRVRPAVAGAVFEVVEAGDFEGLVRWVVGLRKQGSGISVSTLSDPSRLVLDVAGGG